MNDNSYQVMKSGMLCRLCGEKLEFVSTSTINGYRTGKMTIIENVYRCPKCERKSKFRYIKRNSVKKEK